MAGEVLLSIKLTARLAEVTVAAVRAAIRRGTLKAVTLAQAERTAVRFVELREAARYYGWPPALVDRLEGEMRAGVPEGQTVYKMDEGPDRLSGEVRSTADPETAHSADADPSGPDAENATAAEPQTQAGPAGSVSQAPRAADLTTDPNSARDAWRRATTELAKVGQMPAEPPPGFRLIHPRETATLQRREVYDLVVDGEVVGTIADGGFATYVREKCPRGEVFVDGRGGVKWRPRVPLAATDADRDSPSGKEKP